MLAAKSQLIILTRKNSHIFFDIPFERCFGLFCSNSIFTRKKNVEGEKNVKMAIFEKNYFRRLNRLEAPQTPLYQLRVK